MLASQSTSVHLADGHLRLSWRPARRAQRVQSVASLDDPGPHFLVAKVNDHQSSGYQPRKGILIKYRLIQALGLAPDVDALAWS
jgi:hypothetical protein